MAREVVVTLVEEDEDSWEGSLPCQVIPRAAAFFFYSKDALYHFTTTRSVYFYGIMRKTAAKIYQRVIGTWPRLWHPSSVHPDSLRVVRSRGVSREFSTDSSSTLNVYYVFRYKSSSHSKLLFSRSLEYACFHWLTFVFFCPVMVLGTFARKDTMESQVLGVIDRRLQKSLLDWNIKFDYDIV